MTVKELKGFLYGLADDVAVELYHEKKGMCCEITAITYVPHASTLQLEYLESSD